MQCNLPDGGLGWPVAQACFGNAGGNLRPPRDRPLRLALRRQPGRRCEHLAQPDDFKALFVGDTCGERSEEHTSELQSLMRISYAVFCLKKKNNIHNPTLPIYLTSPPNYIKIKLSIHTNRT